jgi:uncharacterized protein (DUF1810 family)
MRPARDPYALQRFVDAQRGVYAQAERELRAGRKESHWMWYIFPQIDDRSIQDIFGYPDHLKFHSSMTLFAHATQDNQVFMDALKKCYRSEFDPQTMKRL